MNGYVYNMSNSGYLLNSDQVEVSVQEGDNVVFIWNFLTQFEINIFSVTHIYPLKSKLYYYFTNLTSPV